MHRLVVYGSHPSFLTEVAAVTGVDWSVVQARDWRFVLHEMIAEVPPGALLFEVGALTPQGIRVLTLMARKGFLPPSGVYLTSVTAPNLMCAWQVAELEVDLVLPSVSGAGIGRFLEHRRGMAAAVLSRYLGTTSGVVRRFFDILHSGGPVLEASVDEVAAVVGLSRSRLYEELARAGAPPVGRCQTLFRMLPGIRVLRMGGTAEDAAHSARMADPTTFRKALRRHLQLSVSDVRDTESVHAVLLRWISVNADRSIVATGLYGSTAHEGEGRPSEAEPVQA